MTPVLKDKAHAKFGASTSERWLECPGSVALIEKAPPQKSSRYADEGTEGHLCLETILKAYITHTRPYTAMHLLKSDHPHDMVDHAFKAFQWVETEHAKRPTATVLCETKVALPVSYPDQYGTVDAAIVELFGRLTVIDYKYGYSPVEPKDNPQLIYYALGLAHQYDYDFEDVEIVIIQPRAEHEAGPVRRWVTTVENLLHWKEVFEQGIQIALDPAAKRKPSAKGGWCKYCAAAVICPELSSHALKEAEIDFEPQAVAPLTLPAPTDAGISLEQLPVALRAAEKIEVWIEKLREHAAHVLERGERVPGWKLVPKRSTRKWVSAEVVAEEAKKIFGKKAFSSPELLSPAQLEKKVGVSNLFLKEFLADHTSSVSSGTTLVTEDDPRPAAKSIAHDFEDIEKVRVATKEKKKNG